MNYNNLIPALIFFITVNGQSDIKTFLSKAIPNLNSSLLETVEVTSIRPIKEEKLEFLLPVGPTTTTQLPSTTTTRIENITTSTSETQTTSFSQNKENGTLIKLEHLLDIQNPDQGVNQTNPDPLVTPSPTTQIMTTLEMTTQANIFGLLAQLGAVPDSMTSPESTTSTTTTTTTTTTPASMKVEIIYEDVEIHPDHLNNIRPELVFQEKLEEHQKGKVILATEDKPSTQ